MQPIASIPDRANPFARRLRLVWRDTLVMDAQCTSVIAYDTARGYFAESFAGTKCQAWLASTFTSATLNRVVELGRLDVSWSDESGYARAIIESLV